MAPDSVAIIGVPKSTFFAVTQRTAPSRPAAAVTSAAMNPSSTLRSTPVRAMPMKAGVAATAQTRARIAGTAIAAVRSAVVLNGNARASPPVRVITRRLPRNGTRPATSARPLISGLSWLIRSASAAYGTNRLTARPTKAPGDRFSRSTSRQISADRPSPRPRVGFTWPFSAIRRSTRMSRINPKSRANIAPCIPLTSDPPESSRARRICSSRDIAKPKNTTSSTTASTAMPAISHCACPAFATTVTGSQPAPTATTTSSSASAPAPKSPCNSLTTAVRSSGCSDAANVTNAALPSPAAALQASTCNQLSPDNAPTSAVVTPGMSSAAAIGARIRDRSRRRRLIGASINQKPSAAEASTGPNMRARLSASAKLASTIADGSSRRPEAQASVLQPAMPLCAFSTADVIIAPSTTTVKIIT